MDESALQTKPTPESPNPIVKQSTVLPGQFVRGVGEETTQTEVLQIPGSLIRMARVIRPQAELREGPGTQFPLNDELLRHGDRIFVFDQLGVWQKVIVEKTGQRGWLHNKTIEENRLVGTVAVPRLKVPTVIVLETISQAYQYPDEKPVEVKIPRGAVFYTFRRELDKRLVWIAETNSVIWLPERNVR